MTTPNLIELSRNAWNALHTESQPAFDDLEESYRQRLLDRAQNVVDRGLVSEDGGIFQTFDQNIIETLQPERFHPLSKQFRPDLFPEPIPEAVKEELIEEVVSEKPRVKKTPAKKAAVKKPAAKAASKRPVKVIKGAVKKGAKKK